jgi:predicted ATPase
VLAAIEQLHAGRLAEHVERLAHHAMRGEVWEKALEYLGQAGAKASGRSAYGEAAAYYDQAIEVLGHLPETADVLRLGIELRLTLNRSLFPLGELSKISRRLDEAEALATAIGNRECLARVLSRRTHHFWSVGKPRSGLDAGQRALAIAMEFDSLPLKIMPSLFLGQLRHAHGDYAAAVKILDEVVA